MRDNEPPAAPGPSLVPAQNLVPEPLESQYQTWTPHRLPDPVGSSTAEIVEGLVSIIAVEGPIVVDRAYRLYARAAGWMKVGKHTRASLNEALHSAIQRGLVKSRNESGRPGYKERVLYLPDSPSVIVRARGDRKFEDIPDSEIAVVMEQFSREARFGSREKIFRRVLEFYETKRLTPEIRDRLVRIDQRDKGHDSIGTA